MIKNDQIFFEYSILVYSILFSLVFTTYMLFETCPKSTRDSRDDVLSVYLCYATSRRDSDLTMCLCFWLMAVLRVSLLLLLMEHHILKAITLPSVPPAISLFPSIYLSSTSSSSHLLRSSLIVFPATRLHSNAQRSIRAMSRVDEIKAEVRYMGYQNVPPGWRCLFPEFLQGNKSSHRWWAHFHQQSTTALFFSSGREIIPCHTIST